LKEQSGGEGVSDGGSTEGVDDRRRSCRQVEEWLGDILDEVIDAASNMAEVECSPEKDYW
jgi:hypothetical protein